MMNDNSGGIIPLYHLVRSEIYSNFELVKDYCSQVRTSSGGVRVANLIHFREAFLKFYIEIDDTAKWNKIGEPVTNELKKYYEDIQKINGETAKDVTDNCRKAIASLGITKIEYNSKDPTKAIYDNY